TTPPSLPTLPLHDALPILENVHPQTLGDTPGPPSVGERRHAFVQHARRRARQRTIDDVGMPGDPADVRHAPIDIFRMNVENPLRSEEHTSELQSHLNLVCR